MKRHLQPSLYSVWFSLYSLQLFLCSEWLSLCSFNGCIQSSIEHVCYDGYLPLAVKYLSSNKMISHDESLIR